MFDEDFHSQPDGGFSQDSNYHGEGGGVNQRPITSYGHPMQYQFKH